MLALRFVRTCQFEAVNLHRFERVASFLKPDPKLMQREVAATVRRAFEMWPDAAPRRCCTACRAAPSFQRSRVRADLPVAEGSCA
jgi:hypothetical protein